MRVFAVLALMMWAWGAGSLYGVGGTQAKMCKTDALAIDPITPFAWPLAVVAITLEGGWGEGDFSCP